MFRPQLQKRLTESCRSQKFQLHETLFANSTPNRASLSISRNYAQSSSNTRSTSARSKAAVSASASAGRASQSSAIASSSSASTGSAALRTAEEREAALRAARLRRLGQQQDREVEEAKKAEEKKEYQKKYNTAARKWVSTIIALPILLVTSYYLFDRLALGNQPKSLHKFREESKAKESEV